MNIRDSIEEKYTNYLNCETDDIDLTVEEAKFILVNDKKVHFVDDLLERAWGVVLSELEKIVSKKQYEKTKKTLKGIINKQNKEIKKKDKIIDEMAIYINNFDIDEDICKKVDEPCKNYAGENGKLCNECIIKYFTNKVEREGK